MIARLADEWRGLWLATTLLTRIPVPAVNANHRTFGRSLHWYPAVGLLIALPLAVLGQSFISPPLMVAALILSLWVLLTGGIHLDGLADCADAWVGGMGSRQKTLAIMKDPASGPIGVSAIVLVLMLKLSALTAVLSLPESTLWWLSPVVARTVLPLTFVATPYVRPGGMGAVLANNFSRPGIAVTTAIVMALCAMLMPAVLWWSWLLASAVVFFIWRCSMISRLGGFTGDGAGALVELLETVLLISIVAIS